MVRYPNRIRTFDGVRHYLWNNKPATKEQAENWKKVWKKKWFYHEEIVKSKWKKFGKSKVPKGHLPIDKGFRVRIVKRTHGYFIYCNHPRENLYYIQHLNGVNYKKSIVGQINS